MDYAICIVAGSNLYSCTPIYLYICTHENRFIRLIIQLVTKYYLTFRLL